MNEFSLRRMEYFVAVADELSVGRAADRLRVTQPVLSRQIAVLERELGAPLFHRSSRGTSLTQAGEAILADAQDRCRSPRSTPRSSRSRRPPSRCS